MLCYVVSVGCSFFVNNSKPAFLVSRNYHFRIISTATKTEAPRSNLRAIVLHFIKSISTFHHLVLLQFNNFDFDCLDCCSWSSEEFIKAPAVVSFYLLVISYWKWKKIIVICGISTKISSISCAAGPESAIPSLLS